MDLDVKQTGSAENLSTGSAVRVKRYARLVSLRGLRSLLASKECRASQFLNLALFKPASYLHVRLRSRFCSRR